MKKITLISFVFFSLMSCVKSVQGYEGTWAGTAPMVKVEYILDGTTFVQNTLSENDIRIGGGKGRIQMTDKTIEFHYSHSYWFDNDTNTGSYQEDERIIHFGYKLNGDSLTLIPEDQSFLRELALERQ